MQEHPAPGVAQDAAGGRAQGLTAEKIESILADFSAWLFQVADAPPAPTPEPEAISLHSLLSQFVALRHEVNLQTKAVRAQQDQNTRSLEALEQAVETMRGMEAAVDDEPEGAVALDLRPLLKSMLDVTDLMTLAGREVQRVREALNTRGTALLEEQRALAELPSPPDEIPEQVRPSLLQRLFGVGRRSAAAEESRPTIEDYRSKLAETLAERDEKLEESWAGICQLVDSIISGYSMSVQRLSRTLEQFGLEPIPAEGQSFDPEMMEVVDAVAGTGLPSGEVVQEVRRGYLWHGRVFRYAQVKVAKS